jgi:tRNA threonylcarbamoyl adenosine modification protein (Sua5/YciO/YrdC/YwlC family)
VVLPTDTVYGIAADAFTPPAGQALLDAKGRGRQMPPPVLIGDVRTLDGLATDVPAAARALAEAFWPGGLTLIVRAQPSLAWDLGETRGTVALRVPDHETARALLLRTGPLAVSSANRTGSPAAVTAQEAYDQLGDSVAVYLDGGPSETGIASTIVDATSLVGDSAAVVRVLREGAVSREALREVLGDLLEADPVREENPPAASPPPPIESSDGGAAQPAGGSEPSPEETSSA